MKTNKKQLFLPLIISIL